MKAPEVLEFKSVRLQVEELAETAAPVAPPPEFGDDDPVAAGLFDEVDNPEEEEEEEEEVPGDFGAGGWGWAAARIKK